MNSLMSIPTWERMTRRRKSYISVLMFYLTSSGRSLKNEKRRQLNSESRSWRLVTLNSTWHFWLRMLSSWCSLKSTNSRPAFKSSRTTTMQLKRNLFLKPQLQHLLKLASMEKNHLPLRQLQKELTPTRSRIIPTHAWTSYSPLPWSNKLFMTWLRSIHQLMAKEKEAKARIPRKVALLKKRKSRSKRASMSRKWGRASASRKEFWGTDLCKSETGHSISSNRGERPLSASTRSLRIGFM